MTNQDELKLAHSGAWSDDEIKRLENMVASGFTNELIAKALGRETASLVVLQAARDNIRGSKSYRL